jgi:hypothetical protein
LGQSLNNPLERVALRNRAGRQKMKQTLKTPQENGFNHAMLVGGPMRL